MIAWIDKVSEGKTGNSESDDKCRKWEPSDGFYAEKPLGAAKPRVECAPSQMSKGFAYKWSVWLRRLFWKAGGVKCQRHLWSICS